MPDSVLPVPGGLFGSVALFNVTLMAAMFSPGPAFLVAVQTNLGAGRRAGLAIGCGLGLVAATWTLGALLGAGAIFARFPGAAVAASLAGGGYLLHLAIRMWRRASVPVNGLPEPARRAFGSGLLVNLLNPKAAFFAAAVVVAIFPGGLGSVESVIVAANHLAVEISFYTALAFALNTRAVTTRYLRAKPWIDRIAATFLAGLALRLLLLAFG